MEKSKVHHLPKHQAMKTYEGISKSSQTKLVMKYMLTFVIGHCCPLQNGPLLSLCMSPAFLPLLELIFWNHV
jgi:hypothetical protein